MKKMISTPAYSIPLQSGVHRCLLFFAGFAAFILEWPKKGIKMKKKMVNKKKKKKKKKNNEEEKKKKKKKM